MGRSGATSPKANLLGEETETRAFPRVLIDNGSMVRIHFSWPFEFLCFLTSFLVIFGCATPLYLENTKTAVSVPYTYQSCQGVWKGKVVDSPRRHGNEVDVYLYLKNDRITLAFGGWVGTDENVSYINGHMEGGFERTNNGMGVCT